MGQVARAVLGAQGQELLLMVSEVSEVSEDLYTRVALLVIIQELYRIIRIVRWILKQRLDLALTVLMDLTVSVVLQVLTVVLPVQLVRHLEVAWFHIILV